MDNSFWDTWGLPIAFGSWLIFALLSQAREEWLLRRRPKSAGTSLQLAKNCPRCGNPLHGTRLTSEKIASRKPPVAWRVCFDCGFEERADVTEPWTLEQRIAREREQQEAKERSLIEEYESQIRALQNRKEKRQLSQLQSLLALSPRAFEEAVAAILDGTGYREVEVCGGAGDLGVDIECISPEGRRSAVQCKRYRDKPVGSKEIQTFIGMVHGHHKIRSAIFVTTSRFTEPASELAKQHKIHLVDGKDLTRMAEALRPSDSDGNEGAQIEHLRGLIESLDTWTIIKKERADQRDRMLRETALERRRRARRYARRY